MQTLRGGLRAASASSETRGMKVRSAAPALVAVIEVEGPTRAWHTATSDADLDALFAWIESSPARSVAVAALVEDRVRTGKVARGVRWEEHLQAESPDTRATIAALSETVLELQSRVRVLEAEARSAPAASHSERLSPDESAGRAS